MTTLRDKQIAAMTNVLVEQRQYTGDDYVPSRALAARMYDAATEVYGPVPPGWVQEPLSYANEPETITSLRASRNANGKDWTVRDALIEALRDYDRGDVFKDEPGLLPTCAIVIVGRVNDVGGTLTSHYQRNDDAYQLRGLVAEAMAQLEAKRRS